MLEFPRWKHVLIVLVALFGLLYALPNMYPQDPSVQVTASRGNQITQALGDRVRNQLDEAGVEVKSIDVDAANGNMIVRLMDLDAQTRASDLLRENLGQDYSVALNLASTVPDWLTGFGASPMVLGLDLQGGVHFVMQVDQAAALERRLESYAEGIRATLRDNRIRYTSVERSGDDSIQAVLSDEADISQAMQLMAVDQPTLNRSVSGNRITTRVPESELGQIARDAIDQNITTLRNRVDEVGVAEPVIQRQGDDRVVVQLPGVQDTAEAKRMIGATATLAYYAVLDGDAYEAARTGVVPPEGRIYYTREQGLDGNPMPYILSRRVIATGEEMVNAQSTYDQNGLPAVSVTLNATAGKRMFDFTSMNVGRPMAVVYIERVPQVRMVDGEEVRTFRDSEEIINVANIQGVFSREFQTTGLEKQEADDLARMLRSGSLAAPMDFIEERIVGPSLGAENVARGITAVGFAFLFTLFFFMLYYRMFGLVTSVALMLNLVLVVAVMSIFGATMTLPGFAGLALSIGLSVDANVLINERIREELRNGMPPKSAIATGYDKASTSILDANITGILAGVALYAFGTGPLRGFAITLVVGISASMFTALVVTRGIVTLIYARRKKLKTLAI